MWSRQPFETLLYKRLEELPEEEKTTLVADYHDARRFVTQEITGLIAAAEPDLTDHSESHLAEVMGRALGLIGKAEGYFTARELYLLAVSILFHDVGNLHGRTEHQQKVSRIYEAARDRKPRFNTERNVILATTGAHTGSAKDGSKDTLREMGPLSFLSETVRAQEIAAVLRLADELAEGPQRTSAYLLNNGMYKPPSRIYHKYASVANYVVDPPLGRIAITYSIYIESGQSGLHAGHGITIPELLSHCYRRAVKLDQERRYCKHYCTLLSAIKETDIALFFYFDSQQLPLDIPPLALTDLVVPGETTRTIEERDKRYDVNALTARLAELCGGSDENL